MALAGQIRRALALARQHRRRADRLWLASIECHKRGWSMKPNQDEATRENKLAKKQFRRAIELIGDEIEA